MKDRYARHEELPRALSLLTFTEAGYETPQARSKSSARIRTE
jgi:hypothetical protein